MLTIAPVSTVFDIITFSALIFIFHAMAFTVLLPFLPLGIWFGLVTPPPAYFGFLLAMVAGFLVAIEPVKRALYAPKIRL